MGEQSKSSRTGLEKMYYNNKLFCNPDNKKIKSERVPLGPPEPERVPLRPPEREAFLIEATRTRGISHQNQRHSHCTMFTLKPPETGNAPMNQSYGNKKIDVGNEFRMEVFQDPRTLIKKNLI